MPNKEKEAKAVALLFVTQKNVADNAMK